MPTSSEYVLVTGATGFIGAHIVDALLAKGFKVRGATRSHAKGASMLEGRPQYADRLDFVVIPDFGNPGGLEEAAKGVDSIIHTASPLTYDTTNNEKELILPAINGMRAVLEAASSNGSIRRIVITSSFASVIDIHRKSPPYYTLSGSDWNPLTYEDAIAPGTNSVVAYRGSKKFAEIEAWNYVEQHKPDFDIVALCPPMTFGPAVNPVSKVGDLNVSNMTLWQVAHGDSPLPIARVPFWIDVRDLAEAHVQALTKADAGQKRYTTTAPERFSYGLAAEIVREEFGDLRGRVTEETQVIDESYGLDGQIAARELGFSYRSFRESVRDFVNQASKLPQ